MPMRVRRPYYRHFLTRAHWVAKVHLKAILFNAESRFNLNKAGGPVGKKVCKDQELEQ